MTKRRGATRRYDSQAQRRPLGRRDRPRLDRWEAPPEVPLRQDEREVQQKLRASIRAREDGASIDQPRQRLGVFLQRWLEDSVRPTRRPATYASYEGLIRVHILPNLGRVPLAELGPEQIQSFLRQKRDEGLSPRTVRYLYSLLHVSLRQAQRWKLIPGNPADLVDAPKKESKQPTPLSAEEARRFLDHVQGDRLEALWVVATTLGLRRGEALGLEWNNVDLDGGTFKVERSIQRIDGRLQFAPLKTARSVRTLPLPSAIVAALRAHKATQLAERLKAGPGWEEHGLIFTTSIGTPLDGRNVTRRLQRLLAEAGIERRTFHELRHSCATLLLALGVQPRVVMQLLGHGQIATSMEIYAHVSPTLEREAADKLDEFLASER